MKIRILISLIVLILFGFFVFQEVNDYINELNNQITIKDERIESLIQSDSIVYEKTKKYSETITKYVNDCNVTIGQTEYSLSEFIDLYIKQINEKIKIKDSLYKLNVLYKASIERYGKPYSFNRKNDSVIELVPHITDIEQNFKDAKESLGLCKNLVEYIEERFDLKSKYTINNNTISYYYNGVERIGSALVLLPYYRHTLSLEGNTWSIQVDDQYLKSERKKKRLERKKNRN